MTIPKLDQLDSLLQIGGVTLAGFLIKMGLKTRRRKTIESLGLTDKNIQWAQDMMNRLEREIKELRARVEDLEAERELLRRELEEYRRKNLILEIKLKQMQDRNA